MIDTHWRKSLIYADSKDIIKRIPDHSIDFIFTDPPYNLSRHSTGNIPLQGRTPMNNDVADWDKIDFHPEEWANEFLRILKPTGNLFIFTSYNQIGRWYDCLDHRFDTSNFMVWHKTNPAPKIFKAGFLNSCEMIFTCWNKGHTWNFISQAEMHNFLESPICMRPERLSNPKHPTQKPLSILRKVIQIASNEGDIIFDPFMGVGSIGVAALELNRRFIGIEIEQEYFQAARTRIEETMNEISPSTLNEPIVAFGVSPWWPPILFSSLDASVQIKLSAKDTSSLQPIIKWAGGKEKELRYILPNVPSEFNRYFEPFVGGGAVFTAIQANELYINDLSSELMSLYNAISEQDKTVFLLIEAINTAWLQTRVFFEQNPSLISLYQGFREESLTPEELKKQIANFCMKQAEQITAILPEELSLDIPTLQSEVKKNLVRKMQRMRVLERQKHLLPEQDVHNNIETALKSALYMYFRTLYNDAEQMHKQPALHTALFFFIRNYSYSGMFRYNASGEFNVPYGGIAYNSKTMDKKLSYYRSTELGHHFAHTHLENLDFEDFLKKYQPKDNDFIFLDPPYDSEFSTYAQNEFTLEDQKRLAHYLIHDCPAHWMMIIKNTPFIYDLYQHEGIRIRTFDKEYLVSFMNRNDKKVTHLLITNY